MADTENTPAPEGAGAVAELAAHAVETSAETAAALEIHTEETAAVIAEVTEELEDEFAWLKLKQEQHSEAMHLMASNLEALPERIAQSIREAVSEVLTKLTPAPSETVEEIPETAKPPENEEGQKAGEKTEAPRRRVTRLL